MTDIPRMPHSNDIMRSIICAQELQTRGRIGLHTLPDSSIPKVTRKKINFWWSLFVPLRFRSSLSLYSTETTSTSAVTTGVRVVQLRRNHKNTNPRRTVRRPAECGRKELGVCFRSLTIQGGLGGRSFELKTCAKVRHTESWNCKGHILRGWIYSRNREIACWPRHNPRVKF